MEVLSQAVRALGLISLHNRDNTKMSGLAKSRGS